MTYKISNGTEIIIDKELWNTLNKLHTKEEIKELIHNEIENNNLTFPLKEHTIEDAKKDFLDLLYSSSGLLLSDDEWFTRYDYNYSTMYNNEFKLIKSLSTGSKSSDYFHQESRMYCDSINAPSPMRSWENRKFRDGALNALWTLKQQEVNSAVLRNVIAMRKYMASQFRPSTAQLMYNLYNAKKVLDLCSGWGDRLAGFFASTATSYVGFDPNTRLVEGYLKQIDFYNSILSEEHLDTKDAVVYCSGSEFMNNYLTDETFDFIFTSPPYFNVEKYSQDEGQSFKQYRKFDSWLNDFLFKTIECAWERLESNGVMAINISDVYSNHTINQICDPMNDFISKLHNSKFLGAIGYEMRKRPNSGALKGKSGKFAEPIWLWRKL